MTGRITFKRGRQRRYPNRDENMFEHACISRNSNGKGPNAPSEEKVRYCATLSSKRPVMSATLPTVKIERAIKFANKQQMGFGRDFQGPPHPTPTPGLMRMGIRYIRRKFIGFTWRRRKFRIRVRRDDAVRIWRDIDPGSQRNWSDREKEGNRKNKDEKDDAEMRGSDDLKTGHSGGSGQTCPIDVDEPSELPHRPNRRSGILISSG